MTLIPLHTKETAPEQARPILERYEKNIGMIPNLFRLLAHSPDALKGVADLHAGLGRSLGARTRERIHIMTAEVNGCDYCLTTHSYLAGKFTKLTPEDMELNRKGHSTDPKADAALQFAYKVAKSRGHIEAADFEEKSNSNSSVVSRRHSACGRVSRSIVRLERASGPGQVRNERCGPSQRLPRSSRGTEVIVKRTRNCSRRLGQCSKRLRIRVRNLSWE